MKIISMFLVIMLILTIVPIALAATEPSSDSDVKMVSATSATTQTDNDTSENNTWHPRLRDEPRPAGAIQGGPSVVANRVTKTVTNRVQICTNFLKANTNVSAPDEVCKKIVAKEADCVKFLKENNVANPVQKCDSFLRLIGQGVQNMPTDKRAALVKRIREKLGDNTNIRANIGKLVQSIKAKNNAQDIIGKLSSGEVKKLSDLPVAAQKVIINSRDPQSRLGEYKTQNVQNAADKFKKRVLSTDAINAANNKFSRIMNKIKNNDGAFKEKRKEFLDVKQKLRVCEAQGSDCEDLVNQAIGTVKDHLNNSLNLAVNELQSLIAKIDSNENIDQDVADRQIGILNSEIDRLNSLINETEAAQTREEVNAVAKKVAVEWHRMKIWANINAGNIINAKVGALIDRGESLVEKLECTISTLDDEGKDTGNLSSLKDELSDILSDAKENNELAREMYLQAMQMRALNENGSLTDEIQNTLQQSAQLTKESEQKVREAVNKVKDILKEIRTTGYVVKDCGGENVKVIDLHPQPEYTPGKDLGLFVWQDNENRWRICASGSQRLDDGDAHVISGTITAQDGFCKVRPYAYENADNMSYGDSKVTFSADVHGYQDCIMLGTQSESISLDVSIDGQETDLIYFGKDKTQYSSPVELQGDAYYRCVSGE